MNNFISNIKKTFNLNTQLIQNYGIILGGNGIIATLSFFQYAVLTRYISNTEIGVFTLFYSAVSFSYIVFTLGLPNTLIIEIPFFKEKDPNRLPQLISSIYISVFFLGIIGFILITLFQGLFYKFLNVLPNQLPIVSFMILPFFALFFINDFIFLGFKQIKTRTMVSVLNISIRFALIMLFIFLGFGFIGVILGLCTSVVIGSIIGFFIHGINNFKGLFANSQDITFVPTKTTFLLGFNLVTLLICNFVISTSNQYIIANVLGPSYVGIYALCIQLTTLVTFVVTPMLLMLIPYVSEKWARYDIPGVQDLKNKLSFIALLSIIPCIIFTIFGQTIISIVFGETYLEGYVPLLIVAYGTVFIIQYNILSNILTCVGRASTISRIIIISSIICLCLNYLLVKIFSLIGAAIATLITYLLMWMLVEFMWKKWLLEKLS